jgi:hypothetical protein
VLLGEGHVGEHVMLGIVYAGAELGPSGAKLISEVAPGLGGRGVIGLEEDLPDRGGNDGVLSLRYVGQRVPHEVDPAALPGGVDDAGDGGLEALVSIGDDQLHTLESAANEVAEEGRPERLGLAGADVEADDLALALGIDRDRYYRGDADDPAAPREP